MLSSKGLSRNLKEVLAVVSSYLDGTDVVKHLDPVLRWWGPFWRYYFFSCPKTLCCRWSCL